MLELPSGSTSSSSGHSSTGSTEARESYPPGLATKSTLNHGLGGLKKMDLFSGFHEDVALLPLVDLWLDLPEQLSQDDIPDPQGLFEERDQIARIIQESRRRAREGPIDLRSSIYSSESSEDAASLRRENVRMTARIKLYLQPLQVVRQIRWNVRKLAAKARCRIGVRYRASAEGDTRGVRARYVSWELYASLIMRSSSRVPPPDGLGQEGKLEPNLAHRSTVLFHWSHRHCSLCSVAVELFAGRGAIQA
ncbi:hypothetical protein OH77DRAFT_1060473 [Trametes cingulata]|nr:hypothetical protein OH77DRAFT_1060473 [Trametes cingulata]